MVEMQKKMPFAQQVWEMNEMKKNGYLYYVNKRI